MSDRPEPPETPDTPDDAGQPGGSGAPDDGWDSAVDHPGRDEAPGPQRPHRMGFSGPSEPDRAGAAADVGDDGGPDLNAMMEQLLGGAKPGAAGMPDLNAMMEQLLGGAKPGAAGMPDLNAMMEQLLGGAKPGAAGMPDLNAMMEQLLGGAKPGAAGMPDLAGMMQRLVGENPGGAGFADAMRRTGVDPSDPSLLATLQSQLGSVFGAQADVSGLDTAKDVARKVVSAGKDRAVSAARQREVAEAVRVAQLWIDPVTTLDAPAGEGVAWSRAEWVDATMPTWHALVDPVAQGVVRAVADSLKRQVDRLGGLGQLPEGLSSVPGLDVSALMRQVQPALERLAGSMFSAQIGHAVGTLAGDVLSGTEVGLPLLRTQDVVLMPAKIEEFAEGLEIDSGEVRLYLAVREAARTRLFAAVPWLGPQLEAAVRDYARHIRIDTDAIEESLRSVDVNDLSALQQALSNNPIFAPTPTPAQQQALTRLETSLALVEGWVDLVTEQATAAHLPHVDALGEAVRRRRAGGPAEKTFSGLVGLELRPRRLKDAKNLWAALQDAGGLDFRDGPWEHPDIAPTAVDLDDPLGFVEKRRGGGAGDAMDSAIDALLSGQPGIGEERGRHVHDDGPQDDGPHDDGPQDDGPQDDGPRDGGGTRG